MQWPDFWSFLHSYIQEAISLCCTGTLNASVCDIASAVRAEWVCKAMLERWEWNKNWLTANKYDINLVLVLDMIIRYVGFEFRKELCTRKHSPVEKWFKPLHQLNQIHRLSSSSTCWHSCIHSCHQLLLQLSYPTVMQRQIKCVRPRLLILSVWQGG